SVPIVAVTPLITLVLGFGYATTVSVASMITFFPTFINMSRGLQATNPQALEMLRVLDVNGWAVFWKLRWPSALPYLFAALRVSGPAAILGAMVAEYIASNAGLGYLIQNASVRYQFVLMWEATILTTAIVIVIFSLVAWAEKRLIPWANDR
ncbi:MAG: ABC transporter permease, partial [Chloroflexota bacterium]